MGGMKSNQKFWICGISAALLSCVGSVFASTQIQGKISSEFTNNPISGAHIQLLLENESQITFSRSDGKFEFNIQDESLPELMLNGKIHVRSLDGKSVSLGNLRDQIANQFIAIDPEIEKSIYLNEIKAP